MRTTSVDARYDHAIRFGTRFRVPLADAVPGARPLGHGPYHHSNREVPLQQRGYGRISTEIRAESRSWIKGSAMEMSLRAAKERTGADIAKEGTKLWIPMLLQ